MSWLHEAITDENGLVDVAYISILWAMTAALSAVGLIVLTSVIAYFRCYTILDVGGGVRAQVPCIFDPQPLGIAVGAIFTGFATMLGALAGYMAATRRRDPPPRPIAPVTTTTTTTADSQTQTKTGPTT